MPQLYTQLFINLPVTDRAAAEAFYTALGFKRNEQLSDDKATLFNLSDTVAVALLPVDHFKEAINGRPVADASTNEVLHAIGLASKDEVITLVEKAVAAGATETQEPIEFSGMYGRAFADLDGHLWNVFYMAA